ncbi:MAG: hypothetical protein AAGC64_14265 [Bacteroidota bacterium]
MIKKLKTFRNFNFGSQFEILGTRSIPVEIKFESIELAEKYDALPELYLRMNNGPEKIVFGIVSNDKSTRRLPFNSRYFSRDQLNVLGRLFGLKVVENPFKNNNFQLSLASVHPDYKSVSPLFIEGDNSYYLLIYSSRRKYPARSMSEDFYGDNIYYFHGIWEVNLDNALIKLLKKS